MWKLARPTDWQRHARYGRYFFGPLGINWTFQGFKPVRSNTVWDPKTKQLRHRYAPWGVNLRNSDYISPAFFDLALWAGRYYVSVHLPAFRRPELFYATSVSDGTDRSKPKN